MIHALMKVLPSEITQGSKFVNELYYQLLNNVFITDNEEIAIAIIDSAIDETLVVYFSKKDDTWFHYTNCHGLGRGDKNDTEYIICEWFDTSS